MDALNMKQKTIASICLLAMASIGNAVRAPDNVPRRIRVEYQQFGGDAAIQLLWHSISTNSDFRVVRSVYLPAGDWFAFYTNRLFAGNQTIQVSAALDEIPVYVRAGSILPLAPAIQHTSELPGGPLELQVYPGKDAACTLVEDDGQTMNYLNGQIRRTTFKWNEATHQLSWTIEGNYSGDDVFRNLHVLVFDPQGKVESNGSLDANGSLTVGACRLKTSLSLLN
jgi:alpha-D-xyloside xylohydrolase